MEVSRQVSRPFTCHTPIIEIGLRSSRFAPVNTYGGPLRAVSAAQLVLTSRLVERDFRIAPGSRANQKLTFAESDSLDRFPQQRNVTYIRSSLGYHNSSHWEPAPCSNEYLVDRCCARQRAGSFPANFPTHNPTHRVRCPVRFSTT
jgi:hypothetical protein